jgi:hypothetical protein
VFNEILSLEFALGCSHIGDAFGKKENEHRLNWFWELKSVGNQAHIPPQYQLSKSAVGNLPKWTAKKAVATLFFTNFVGLSEEVGVAHTTR